MIEPLQVQSAPLFLGKLTSRPGTLVLLPDRLAFVEARAPARSAAFGAIGMLFAQRAAKSGASARATAGGDGVITVGLGDLRAVMRGRQGLNDNVLIVSGPGAELKLGVDYDRWAPAIAAAARSCGRRCTASQDTVEFA